MKATTNFLAWLVLLLSMGQASHAQVNQGGILVATNFGSWTVAKGNNGPFSWSSSQVCTSVSASGSINFKPFVVGSPIRIVDQAAPTNSETVTVTAVNILGSGCSISTSTPANQHYSFYLTSATAGLQEAINYSKQIGLASVVVTSPDWALAGGITSTIVNAQGSSAITILDLRISYLVPYAWNGTIYVAQPIGNSVTSFSAGNLAPLFSTTVTNPSTTPALSFAASVAAQNSVLAGPATGGAGVYSFQTAPTISAANFFGFPSWLVPPVTDNLIIGSTGVNNPNRATSIVPSNVGLLTFAASETFNTTFTPGSPTTVVPVAFTATNVPYSGSGDNATTRVVLTVGTSTGAGFTNTFAAMGWVADATMPYAFIGTNLFGSPVALRGSQMWFSGGSNFINHPTCVPVVVGNVSQVGTDGTVSNGLNVGTTNQLKVDCSGNLTTSGSITGASYQVGSVAAKLIVTGTITMSSGTSDSATVTGMSAASRCNFSPTNATATGSTIAAYISTKATNSITFTHAATVANGATFDIVCSVN